MSDPNVFLNGRLIPQSQASISVADAGFLHGASAFTTLYARRTRAFRLDQHLARLVKTAESLELSCEADAEFLREAVTRLLEDRDLPELRVRITLSPGDVHAGEPTTLITAQQVGPRPETWDTGLLVTVSPYKQVPTNPETGVKTGCYFPRVLALRDAATKGAQEALWYTIDNHLSEACFSNVFLVLGPKVHTPPLGEGVLPGVVRGAVLEICRQEGIPFDDATRLSVQEMLTADECFLTNSVAGIRPVVQIEKHRVGDGKPGRLTRRIREAYAELVDKECGHVE